MENATTLGISLVIGPEHRFTEIRFSDCCALVSVTQTNGALQDLAASSSSFILPRHVLGFGNVI